MHLFKEVIKVENWINNFVVFLEKDKKLSNNTLQSYRRDILQYKNYVEENNIKSNI